MNPLNQVSPFARHCIKWQNGCGSEECGGARKVFARGSIPCGILFVGEAPGESEDVIGYPFKGPAGQLQDEMLKTVNARTKGKLSEVKFAFTNVVGCIPRNENKKADEPTDEQISFCTPRLEEFMEICQPRLIIAVGQIAEDYLEQGYKFSIRTPNSVREVVRVTHPSAILRAKVAQQSLLRQRYIVTVTNAVIRHF